MTWLGGSELMAGLVVVAMAVLVTLALGRRGRRVGTNTPSHLFMALVPVSILLIYVVGIMLILHGVGVV